MAQHFQDTKVQISNRYACKNHYFKYLNILCKNQYFKYIYDAVWVLSVIFRPKLKHKIAPRCPGGVVWWYRPRLQSYGSWDRILPGCRVVVFNENKKDCLKMEKSKSAEHGLYCGWTRTLETFLNTSPSPPRSRLWSPSKTRSWRKIIVFTMYYTVCIVCMYLP
jgi:hypothetical protein